MNAKLITTSLARFSQQKILLFPLAQELELQKTLLVRFFGQLFMSLTFAKVDKQTKSISLFS